MAWYGICYAIGIAAAYVVITREARRRGLDARLVDNGIIIVAAAALIGGRLYHVIDQWHLYQDDPLKIVLPPYSGLGVYGGIITGTIAAWYLTRRWHQSFPKWADVIAPGPVRHAGDRALGQLLQPGAVRAADRPAVGHRDRLRPPGRRPRDPAVPVRAVPGRRPPASTRCSCTSRSAGSSGRVTLLWIARRYGRRMRPGDLVLIFFIWYAAVRFALETLRTGNWTFFGIPTAMVVSAAVIVISLVALAWRHRPGAAWRAVGRSGAVGRRRRRGMARDDGRGAQPTTTVDEDEARRGRGATRTTAERDDAATEARRP